MDERSQECGEDQSPWQVFHMIIGTSTGGLIAIMLGRLRMTVDECIDAYLALMGPIFAPGWASWAPLGMKLNIRSKYNTPELEKGIKKLVESKLGNEDELLWDDRPDACKVGVIAMHGENAEKVVLSSYRKKKASAGLDQTIKIWEAARATSAATSFFDPIIIGRFKQRFHDGATGANNPVNLLWREALREFAGDDNVRLQAELQCLISLGTGQPDEQEWTTKATDVINRLKEFATETATTATIFEDNHATLRDKHYFRFDPQGVGGIMLDDPERKNVIVTRTESYLKRGPIWDNVLRAANSLKGLGRHRVSSFMAISMLPQLHEEVKFFGEKTREPLLQSVISKFECRQLGDIDVVVLHGLRGIGKSDLAWRTADRLQSYHNNRLRSTSTCQASFEQQATIAADQNLASREPALAHKSESDRESWHDPIEGFEDIECAPEDEHVTEGIAAPHRGCARPNRTSVDRDKLATPRGLYVFWVVATNRESFLSSYELIARKLGLFDPSETKPRDSVLHTVKAWLQRQMGIDWLLILDDINPKMMDFHIQQYLPDPNPDTHGMLLMTSVTGDLSLPWQDIKYFNIGALDPTEAESLWKWHSRQTGTAQSDVVSLLSTLEYNPSAILSASAYLRKNKRTETVASYLASFIGNIEARRQRISVKGATFSFHSGIHGSSPSIIESWQKTFDTLGGESQEAAEFLYTLLCLNATHIPKRFLGKELHDTKRQEYVNLLVTYGILKLERALSGQQQFFYHMPHLIHLIGRSWLLQQKEERKVSPLHLAQTKALDWLGSYVNSLGSGLKTLLREGHYVEVAARQRELVPHVEVLQSYCVDCVKHELYTSPDERALLTAERISTILDLACLYRTEERSRDAYDLLYFAYCLYHADDLVRARCLAEFADCIRNLPQNTNASRRKILKKASDMISQAESICRSHSTEPQHRNVLMMILDTQLLVQLDRLELESETRLDHFYQEAMNTQKRAMALQMELGEASPEFQECKLHRSKIHYVKGQLLRNHPDPTRENQRKTCLELAKQDQTDVLMSLTKGPYKDEKGITTVICATQAALGRTSYELGLFDAGERSLQTAYDERSRIFGESHRKTLTTGQDLSLCIAQRSQEDVMSLSEKMSHLMYREHELS
ncbi:hypothetical protein D6C93_04726 [Aureobasidium pullulans]|nr:hypothetical protein D6C93_04726 [Aureobasidium pullulans]